MKEKLLGKTLPQLRQVTDRLGMPSYAAGQLARWLYKGKAADFESMTDISKSFRSALSESFDIGRSDCIARQSSSDGTQKYLFAADAVHPDGRREKYSVETVMIPEEDRRTLCVSSQAGCRMGCKFCMTGRQGFHGNLSSADILNQILSVPDSDYLTNVVFMGMGEPLDNWENVKDALDVITSSWGLGWSPKRVTLSTIGVLPALKLFLDESRCHLAVSLHNPFPLSRKEFMPVQKAWPEEEILSFLRQYDFSGQRRVSFEYTLFEGWNDSKAHAAELARMLRGLECRVNLIRFHRIPDFPYGPPEQSKIIAFRDFLSSRGVIATIRASRGEDIAAACGMLAGQGSSAT